ncbi:MAG: TetR/AcrR family transcriptional regulator [Ilumatobacteraceae bacterium]
MARPLSSEARRKMLDATRAVIADVGPDALTIDEVARRSGVAKTTIYRHFPTTSALILNALADVPASVTAPGTGDLRADLRDIVGQFIAIAADGTVRQMMLHALDTGTDDPEFARIHTELREGRRNPIRTALEQARSRGDIPVGLDIDLAATVIEAPFIVQRLIADLPVTEDDIDSILDLLLPGLWST